MLTNRFKVRYKGTNEIYEVYDITYSGDDNEHVNFLVFIGGYFKQYDSACFEPYVDEQTEIYKRDCKNKTYSWTVNKI